MRFTVELAAKLLHIRLKPKINAAKIYDKLGDKETSRKIRKELAVIQEKIWRSRLEKLGEENPFTISARKSFEETIKALKPETITLCKGQRIRIDENIDKLTFNFTWDNVDSLEIDTSAFLLDANGKTCTDENFIFYGNIAHSSGSVELDNNALHIEPKKIPDEVEKIVLALTIYEADERGQNFGMVRNAALKIFDGQNELATLLLENFTVETALIVGEVYRHKGEWKFRAIGAGFKGGLKILCQNFGLEVD